MILLNFLHFYQPASQQKDILQAVVEQCYRPVFIKLAKLTKASITININGSLLELLDKFGYRDLLADLRTSVESGDVEITGSCKYHSLLPLIPEEEAIRQIKNNEETLRKYLGQTIKIKGFFPPEMAIDKKSMKIIEKLGYEWVIVDEISNSDGFLDGTTENIYSEKETHLKTLFRVRRVSNLIMSAVVRNEESLREAIKTDLSKDGYLVTGMDGETFGHHRVGYEKMLFEILDSTEIASSTISNYLDSHSQEKTKEVEIKACTWASSPQDISDGMQFASWKDEKNEIHKLQWALLNLSLSIINKYKNDSKEYELARQKMDRALASDQYFWASGKPWWSLEMIEDGAYMLLDVVRTTPGSTDEEKQKASELYEKILSLSFNWQRSGKIREMAREQSQVLRIPFKDRTLGACGAEPAVYNAFIDMINKQEKKAVENREYEKALLWRDALYKIDIKNDIYDTINAIDLLRAEIGNEEVEKVIQKYKQEYLVIRGGQPEQRGR